MDEEQKKLDDEYEKLTEEFQDVKGKYEALEAQIQSLFDEMSGSGSESQKNEDAENATPQQSITEQTEKKKTLSGPLKMTVSLLYQAVSVFTVPVLSLSWRRRLS